MVDKNVIASIIISLIGALSAAAAARAAAKASIKNTSTSSRVEMEKEAYERARALDTETIARQKSEISELYAEADDHERDIQQLHYANNKLHDDYKVAMEQNRQLQDQLYELRRRFTRIETEVETNPMIRRPPSNGRE